MEMQNKLNTISNAVNLSQEASDLEKRSGLNRLVRSFAIVGLLGLSLMQSACTDREVAAGVVGAVIGGVIVGAHASDSYHPPRPPRCQDRVQVVCRDYYDNWGRASRFCEEVRTRSCSRYNIAFENQNMTASQLSPKMVAEAFSLSDEAANRVIDALVRSESGDLDAFNDIGLTKEEVRDLAYLNAPKQESVGRLAHGLSTSEQNARNIIQRITDYAKRKMMEKTPSAPASNDR